MLLSREEPATDHMESCLHERNMVWPQDLTAEQELNGT